MANTYSNVGGTGSGEANTASSKGVDPDKEIVAGKEGVDLKFKRLSAGNGVTLDSDNDKVTINATGGAANAFSTIQSPSGADLIADSDTDRLVLTSSNGTVNIENSEVSGEDTINFTVNNSLLGLNDTFITSAQPGEVLTYNNNRWENAPASGGAANAFSTISVFGNDDVVAESSSDRLTFESDLPGGIGISTDSANDKIKLYVDLNTLSTETNPTIVDHSILTYNPLFGSNYRVPVVNLFGSTPIERLQNVADVSASEGEVLTYTGSSWTAQAPAAGGGGVTVIADAGTIGGSYDGDVIVEGNATVNADIVIRGSLYFTKTATLTTLNAENTGHSLEVFGDVIATSDNTNEALLNFRNDTGSTASVKIHGDCVYCDINTYSAGADLGGGTVYVGGSFLGGNIQTFGGPGATQTNNGGSVTIKGNAVIGTLYTYGGNSSGAVSAGNGGNVVIKGNAVMNFLDSKGGEKFNSTAGSGGAGADVSIDGNLIVTGSICTVAGGNSAASASPAGSGGSLTVKGNFTYENSSIVNLQGGNNFNHNGGVGGDITVHGKTSFTNTAGIPTLSTNGGNGDTAGNAGNLTFYGHVYTTGNITANGGFGVTNGGNAPTSPRLLGGVDIANLEMQGYIGSPSANAGIAPEDAIISGGGFIRDLKIQEGDATTPSVTKQTTLLTNGSYVITKVHRKGNGRENLRLKNCTLNVDDLAAGAGSDLSLTDNTGAGNRQTVTNPDTKLYRADEATITAVIFNDVL